MCNIQLAVVSMEMIERAGADKMSRIEGRTGGSDSVDYNH